MTRIDDVAGIVRSYFKESEHYPNLWEDIAGSLDIAGHLMPDLPEPTNSDPDYAPIWQVGGVEYEGQRNGSVLIDTGSSSGPLVITRQQVLLILAASESRGARQ